jgi:hypothetical protein
MRNRKRKSKVEAGSQESEAQRKELTTDNWQLATGN